MEVTYAEDIARIKLRGRLDTPGVDGIETKFTASVLPDGRNAVVDLSEVSFIASMGLRMFIGIAKALKKKKRDDCALRAAIAGQRDILHCASCQYRTGRCG